MINCLFLGFLVTGGQYCHCINTLQHHPIWSTDTRTHENEQWASWNLWPYKTLIRLLFSVLDNMYYLDWTKTKIEDRIKTPLPAKYSLSKVLIYVSFPVCTQYWFTFLFLFSSLHWWLTFFLKHEQDITNILSFCSKIIFWHLKESERITMVELYLGLCWKQISLFKRM